MYLGFVARRIAHLLWLVSPGEESPAVCCLSPPRDHTVVHVVACSSEPQHQLPLGGPGRLCEMQPSDCRRGWEQLGRSFSAASWEEAVRT